MNETLQKPLVRVEQGEPSPEAPKKPNTPDALLEQKKSLEVIEEQLLQTEQLAEKLETVSSGMSPQEQQVVGHALLEKEAGKSATANLQEKTVHLLQAGHHLKDELSEKYNPKITRIVGRVGKIIGGVSGALMGHGVASAVGGVAGMKIGEYGALKTFEKVAQKLPDAWQEKILKKESLQNIESSQEIIHAKIEKLKELDHSFEIINKEIADLSPEKRAAFEKLMSESKEIVPAIDRLKSAYHSYGHFCESIEKKYPVLGLLSETAIHAALGPVLEGIGTGKELLHTLELLGASGGVEKLTIHAIHGYDALKKSTTDSVNHVISLFKK